ncbi:hypothetical protein DFH06DRAFT_1400433 [Mycena polygramma]|nr:hypothetical protein DFH06DRAFT_1400433 [Mycena polygramma]
MLTRNLLIQSTCVADPFLLVLHAGGVRRGEEHKRLRLLLLLERAVVDAVLRTECGAAGRSKSSRDAIVGSVLFLSEPRDASSWLCGPAGEGGHGKWRACALAQMSGVWPYAPSHSATGNEQIKKRKRRSERIHELKVDGSRSRVALSNDEVERNTEGPHLVLLTLEVIGIRRRWTMHRTMRAQSLLALKTERQSTKKRRARFESTAGASVTGERPETHRGGLAVLHCSPPPRVFREGGFGEHEGKQQQRYEPRVWSHRVQPAGCTRQQAQATPIKTQPSNASSRFGVLSMTAIRANKIL